MTYSEVINILFFVISSILPLFFVPYLIFAIVGIFTRKKFPHAEHKSRYGIVVPARNEERVISNLIESIRQCDYPQELLDIFIVAHNCTDRTVEIVSQMGEHVYEYHSPEDKTLGYAYQFIFNKIEEDFGRSNYDGFFIFNADNSVEKDYFDKMNDAFEYYDRKYVLTSFRQASNFNENLMSVLYGAFFATAFFLSDRGRTVMDTSIRIYGCGYLFSSDLVKDGWNYFGMTEDLELSVKESMKGTQIRYCDDAVFYDEQPTSVRIMWRQRLRWAKGVLEVSRENFLKCLKASFDPKRKDKFASYDLAVFISRFPVIALLLMILHVLALFLAPFFGQSLADAFLYWDSTKLWWEPLLYPANVGGIYLFAADFAKAYGATMLVYLLVMFLGRKRFRPDSLFKMVGGMFLFPLFLTAGVIMDIQAIFSKNLTWKQIPHTGNKDLV